MWEEANEILNPGHIILDSIVAIVGAAALALVASASIPGVRRRMLPPAAQDELWTFLPFSNVADDRKTLVSKDRHIRVLELQGAELTLSNDKAHESLYDDRRLWIDSLELHGIDHVKIVTLKQEISLPRQLRASNTVLRQMDMAWERNFPTPTRLTHYVIIVAKGKTLDDTRQALDASEAAAMTMLEKYRPKVLIEPESFAIEDFDSEDTRPSGPLKPFAQVLSPINPPSPLGYRHVGKISALLTTNTVDFSRYKSGIIAFSQNGEKRYAAVMTWRDCGDRTSEAIMRELSAIDSEMIIYHAIQPIPTTMALMKLGQERRSATTAHLSANAEGAYDEVLRKVEGHIAGDKATLAYYAMHVIPICKTEKRLEQVVKDITRIMSRTTGTAIALKAMAQPTFMSMADSEQAWPRRFRFLSTNVAACAYLQRTTRGHLRSDWCDEPLAWLRTISGDPYPMQFHVDDKKEAVGHTLVIGNTGSGKTTLMTFLVACAQRVPRLRTYLFDRLYGMKVFTTCAGGQYLDFDDAAAAPLFNPLHMPDSPQTRTFLLAWMQEITGQSDSVSRGEFARMIKLLYGSKTVSMEMRSLKRFANAAFSSTGLAKHALEPWLNDAQYGRVFNADAESMNLTGGRLTGFNMTKVLNDDVLAPAVISYLVHRIQSISMETKDPSLILVDEARAMLRNETFATRFLETGLLEGRKLRQAYVLCFQSPGTLMDTKRQQIIIDQCHTKILFRIGNDSETSLEQYRMFGLNQAQLDFLANKTFKEFRYAVLIVKNSGESAIVDCDIGPLGKHARMFRSGTESVGEIEALLRLMPRELAVKAYIDGEFPAAA